MEGRSKKCQLKTKILCFSRLYLSLDPPKSPLKRGTLSAPSFRVFNEDFECSCPRVFNRDFECSCPPPYYGGLGGLSGFKNTLGAIAFMPPLSPQQQEFQSNQSDNFQSLDWPKVGRKRDRVVRGPRTHQQQSASIQHTSRCARPQHCRIPCVANQTVRLCRRDLKQKGGG